MLGSNHPDRASLERILQAASERNPADSLAPALRNSISVVSAPSAEEAKRLVEAGTSKAGELVFRLAFPADPQQPGYLAGAARLKAPVGGSSTASEVTSLE